MALTYSVHHCTLIQRCEQPANVSKRLLTSLCSTIAAMKRSSSRASISPFTRPFPLEVLAEIVRQMDRDELVVFSLTNKVFSDEANRVLWKTAHITFDPISRTLMPSCKAIRRDSRRARHIQRIILAPHYDRYLPGPSSRPSSPGFPSDEDVPDEVPLWTWKLISAIIRTAPNLLHLEILDLPPTWLGLLAWRIPVLDMLLDAARPGPLIRLRSFTTSLPLEPKLAVFFTRLPSVNRITLHKTYAMKLPYSHNTTHQPLIPQKSLQHLTHFSGPLDFICSIAPGRPLTHIHTNLGVSRAEDLRSALSKSAMDVQSLSISSIFSSTHPLAPVLLRLAPLPVTSLYTKYLLSNSSFHSLSLFGIPAYEGAQDIHRTRGVCELWTDAIPRALDRFRELETFRCDVIVQTRMQVSEMEELLLTTERVCSGKWGAKSRALRCVHFAYKHSHGVVHLKFTRSVPGGFWTKEDDV